MAVAFDAASNSGEVLADDAYGFNHTVSGSDRFLLVAVAIANPGGVTVTDINYVGSGSLTLIAAIQSSGGEVRIELWGMMNPETGTASVNVTLSASADSAAAAVSYTGVYAFEGTYEGEDTAEGTESSGVAALSITGTFANDMYLSCICSDDTSITESAGTARANVSGTVLSLGFLDIGTQAAGAHDVNWQDLDTGKVFAIAGLALIPKQPATKLAFAATIDNAVEDGILEDSGTGNFSVFVQDALSHVVVGATNEITIAIGTNPSGGTLSGDGVKNAAEGIGTFDDLSIDNAGTGYTLTAAASGLTGDTSNAFDIVAPVSGFRGMLLLGVGV